jgi:FtsZ-binding cell division protein ZapB
MEAFEKLEEKINKALTLIEKLTEENKVLRSENDRMKKELAEAKDKLGNLERLEAEWSDKMKNKLNNILGKLGALEKI